LKWLAVTGPPQLEIDKFPSASDVHTNIVAGLVSADGRTVVARLPQAVAEFDAIPAPPMPAGFFSGDDKRQIEIPEFTLVRGDGKRIAAKFVGLDATTGLSLLEAAEALFPPIEHGDEGHTETPIVGQRVHLFAPARVAAPSPPSPTYYNSGDAGVIYLGMGQAEGLLTDIKHTTSGKAVHATVSSKSASPAWTGAVATDESGALLGIVTQSGVKETQLVSIDALRGASERVLAHRASVPQPWLGARGDAASPATLPLLYEKGWTPEMLAPLMKNLQGVFLTSVAPGTPAALAGLRPGDVISRVGERDVRGVEDLSMMLNEAGVGSKLDFTVLRALELSPLKVPVVLSGTQNPALATAEAEARAARTMLRAAQAERREFELEALRLRADTRTEPTTVAELQVRARAVEERFARARSQVAQTEARVAQARLRMAGAAGGSAAAPPSYIGFPGRPLQAIGLEVIGLTPRSAPRLKAKGGVLVVFVRPESPAALAGLRPGDVIETINKQTFTRLDLGDKLQRAGDGKISLGIVREGKRLVLSLEAPGGPQPEP
jgi:S1-C subfamily serine protease